MSHSVAIIGARGGSKGIPRKNLLDFCGKPLLAWSIEQAKAASGIHSDSDEILQVAASYGARTVLRPDSLSGDKATSESAWRHAMDEIEKQGIPLERVIAMQATSPLREPEDLERGIADFVKQGCDSMFSAAGIGDFYLWTKSVEGELNSLNYDYLNRKRRQNIQEQYVENGSFYIFKPEIIRAHDNRLGGKIGVTLMEFWKSFEIDHLESLKMCEVLMKAYLL
jgi:CMP-N,N'-diacetyllegionaminic acid synthase